MNNLHRELAPISDAAWAEIEEEAARTLKRYLAGRRVVDMRGPAGVRLSAVGTGHLKDIAAPGDGIFARQREVEADRRAACPVRAGSRCDRRCGAWSATTPTGNRQRMPRRRSPLRRTAPSSMAMPPRRSEGIRQGTSNPIMTLPADVRDYPDAIAQALSQLRLVGVNGPYTVLLGADAYTALAETRDHGYPVLEHVKRLVNDEIIWAPAIAGALRADHPRRRFRPAHRPGRLDRLLQPHRRGGLAVPAGDLHLSAPHVRGRGRAVAGEGRAARLTSALRSA